MRLSREVADGRTERDAMCEIFLTTARSSHCAPTERRLLVSGKFISERLARSNESAAEISTVPRARVSSFRFRLRTRRGHRAAQKKGLWGRKSLWPKSVASFKAKSVCQVKFLSRLALRPDPSAIESAFLRCSTPPSTMRRGHVRTIASAILRPRCVN